MWAGYLTLALAIGFENLGTTALKGSDGLKKPALVALSVLGYVLSSLMLGLTLARLPLGLTYALWSGLGLTLVTCLGVLLYGERFSRRSALGLVLVIGGILLINLSLQSGAPGIGLK
ncbi:multidrug efflux SMR transporter [Synechococcus sp. HK05]|uniref:DMT family transporter n=1 Tax=Synechococcus sp. HK05 TaxID=2725975 RepID=UPI001C38008A|nr:multidrug efflux SMR transporter [Synechococcus sp. HK05]MBV2350463.1 multidrug efflux SMR transporter [Synechococcus sp. HK05]